MEEEKRTPAGPREQQLPQQPDAETQPRGTGPPAKAPPDDLLAELHRHQEILADIAGHLDALVHLTTKQRLGSPHLGIAETAAYLGVATDTLKKKMTGGAVPFHRRAGTAPYFLKPELDAWLEDPTTLVPARPTQPQETEFANDRPDAVPFDEAQIQRLLDRAEPPDTGPDQD